MLQRLMFAVAPRHVVFWCQRPLLHPLQVTLALFRRHLTTHFEKVIEHVLLALHPQFASFLELLFDRFRIDVRASHELLKLCMFCGDPLAEFRATRRVTVMQCGDTLKLRVAQLKLLLQPGEFRCGVFKHLTMLSRPAVIQRAITSHGRKQTDNEDQCRAFHYSLR